MTAEWPTPLHSTTNLVTFCTHLRTVPAAPAYACETKGVGVNREQAAAIAQTVHTLRPAWNVEGVFAALGKCQDRDPFEVALAAIRAAADPQARTPGVIPGPGPHWNELPPKAPDRPAQPARAGTCEVTYLALDVCRGLWATDHACRPIPQAAAGRSTGPGDTLRAELAAVRAKACRHGIVRDRGRCAECETVARRRDADSEPATGVF